MAGSSVLWRAPFWFTARADDLAGVRLGAAACPARFVSRLLYRKTIFGGAEFVLLCQKLFKFLSIDHVYFKHPLAIRHLRLNLELSHVYPRSPVSNGVIAIKYWPIDSYQKLFDNDKLKQFISDGYLLNDIAFFLEQGLVELWPKPDTVIDREERTIRWKDNVIRYDHIVEADHEVPNLPDIIVDRAGAPRRKYEYVCRNTHGGHPQGIEQRLLHWIHEADDRRVEQHRRDAVPVHAQADRRLQLPS
jgi:hypothetical protein